MTDDTEWHIAANAYLRRLGESEYAAQRSRDKRKAFRYSPSAYMRDLIDCLNRNDENGFKSRKMLEGYSSSLGV